MKQQDFIESFAAQYDDVEVSSLTLDTLFRNVEGWSSLTALSIIAMIDEEYDVCLNGNDIRASETIGDIINIVNTKI